MRVLLAGPDFEENLCLSGTEIYSFCAGADAIAHHRIVLQRQTSYGRWHCAFERAHMAATPGSNGSAGSRCQIE
jgi:hypothetical protein